MSHQNDHFCFVITTMAIFSDFFSAGLLSLFTFKTFVSSLFQVQFSISFNTIFEETTAVRQGGTSLLKETKFQLFFWQSSSLLWCPVFKSASSSWTFHIIALSGCCFLHVRSQVAFSLRGQSFSSKHCSGASENQVSALQKQFPQ